jgi:signal transduction histidine kinase
MTLPSLRVRIALLSFMAGYLPVLLLFGGLLVLDNESITEIRDGVETTNVYRVSGMRWYTWAIIALAPVAAVLSWWVAGRAVRPIERVRSVVEQIGAADLDRRVGLTSGPVEIVSLAASFDGLLDRLERSAETQRRLIEETSHELRTPLSVLATNAEVLLAHPEPTVELYRQGLDRSRRAADRLRHTIDELLVDARGRARVLDRRPTDLMALVRDVAAELTVPGRATVSVTGPRVVECAVDQLTVRRAIANLVDNAVRHAPPESVVTIAVEVVDSMVAVTVTDHGPGIPETEQPHIFERFWRGPGDRPGTGLGLPIARQIALAHGGELTLTSPAPTGDGCAFTLTLRR